MSRKVADVLGTRCERILAGQPNPADSLAVGFIFGILPANPFCFPIFGMQQAHLPPGIRLSTPRLARPRPTLEPSSNIVCAIPEPGRDTRYPRTQRNCLCRCPKHRLCRCADFRDCWLPGFHRRPASSCARSCRFAMKVAESPGRCRGDFPGIRSAGGRERAAAVEPRIAMAIDHIQ